MVTFEYTSTVAAQQPHSILFIGGLGDGLATSSFTVDVVRALQPTKWSLFTLNLSSSHSQWGLGHLDRDTQEINECANYIKSYKMAKYGGKSKLVIMGHSTGSQCVLHYLSQPNPITDAVAFDQDLEHSSRLQIDGAIMQAPVSDREAIMMVLRDGFVGQSPEEMQATWANAEAFAREAAEAAEKEASQGGGKALDTIIPLWMTAPVYFNVPISCRRFLSLTSPDSPQQPGADDMFSSDLAEEELQKSFGMISQRGLLRSKLMVLMSGRDKAVPEWVDKEKLMAKWKAAADRDSAVWDNQHSGIIPGASHALSDSDQAEPRKWLAERILSYLKTINEE